MSETDFDIDAAGAEFDQAKQERAEEQQTLPLIEVDEDVDVDEDEPTPPGFLSYEDYVEQGGDPDMYRGKQAFAAEHERIEENKRLRRDVKGLQSTVQQTMDAVSEWQGQERTKIKRQVEAELHTAKENEDVNAAIDAQQRLDKLADEPEKPQAYIEPPVIQQFREDNPMIDGESDDYNEDFNLAVEGFYNDLYNRLSQNGRRKVSDTQIKRCLNKAMGEARELHGIEVNGSNTPEDDPPRESARNQRRRGQQRGRRPQAKQPVAAKAEDFKIENPKNGRDTSGADVRDMIHQKALKSALKAGKSTTDATAYADEQTKRFEESLNR